MRWLARLAAFLLFVAASGAAWVTVKLNDRPSLEPYAAHWLPALPEPAAARLPLRVRFLGVSTLLFDDGRNAVLIDGFFSRPGALAVLLGRVGPDAQAVARGLARAGIARLDAVVAAHSHYDHAMDSPEVARQTGALVVGSESTAQIARGAGLAEDRIRVVRGGQTLRFGAFELRFTESVHAPTPFTGGAITAPLVPPVRASAYLEGTSYSILVTHPAGSALVQASAGFVPGALAGQRADVAFLGVGALGPLDDAYHARYWDETVGRVGARRVIPIHWDDFLRPLEPPLPVSPGLIDDVDRSLQLLLQRGKAAAVDVRLPPPWVVIDPWAGLRG